MLRMLGKAERLKLAESFGSLKPSNYPSALNLGKSILSSVTLLPHTGDLIFSGGGGGLDEEV